MSLEASNDYFPDTGEFSSFEFPVGPLQTENLNLETYFFPSTAARHWP